MLSVFNTALRTKLVDNAGIAAIVGARVYADLATDDAALPYIVFNVNSGRELDRAWGVEERIVVYSVLGWTDDEAGLEKAVQMADAIYAALNRQTLTLGDGWTFYQCRMQSPVQMAPIIAQRKYKAAGGLYRLEADNYSR